MQPLRNRAHKVFVQKTDHGMVQLVRYFFVAMVAFAADFVSLIALTEFAHVHYVLSASIAFCFGLLINYALSVRWVFGVRSVTSRRMEFLAFGIIGVIGLFMTALCMWLLTDFLHIFYIVSKVIVTGVVFFWNFLARKYLLFNNKE